LNASSDTLVLTVKKSQFADERLVIEAGDQEITNLRVILKIAVLKESVVVSVTRSERSLADQPASVSLVSEAQLEETPA
jgi:hypothetical protein